MNTVKLSNGVLMPGIGFGVYQTKSGKETENAVEWALEAGYRHIDTAMIYGNETSVGKAVKKSGIPRDSLFITTKLWNEDIRKERVDQAFEKSLENLGLDYIDLYLIHWPAQGFEKAWKVMEELYNKGKIKAVGVSNFQIHHLKELEKVSALKPMVNQIESNPVFNNQDLINYCKNENILVEAWSPLGGTGTSILGIQELESLGKKYNKSPAQIVIKWHLQRGVVPLPKSVHRERIFSNIDVYDFTLDSRDIELINSLNRNTRVGPDPDNFDF